MPRNRLPDRRQAETVDLWHGGRRFHLTVGEYLDGSPGEVFIHGAKPGSDVDLLCDDIGVLLSRLLQFGDDPASLAAGVGRLGNGDPASIVGAIADLLAAKGAGPSSPPNPARSHAQGGRSRRHAAPRQRPLPQRR